MLTLTIFKTGNNSQMMGQQMVIGPKGGTVGRGQGNSWSLLDDEDKLISRTHFSIQFQEGNYMLKDTSTNGTLINDQLVGNGKMMPVRDGDVVKIGNYHIRLSLDAIQTANPPSNDLGARPSFLLGETALTTPHTPTDTLDEALLRGMANGTMASPPGSPPEPAIDAAWQGTIGLTNTAPVNIDQLLAPTDAVFGSAGISKLTNDGLPQAWGSSQQISVPGFAASEASSFTGGAGSAEPSPFYGLHTNSGQSAQNPFLPPEDALANNPGIHFPRSGNLTYGGMGNNPFPSGENPWPGKSTDAPNNFQPATAGNAHQSVIPDDWLDAVSLPSQKTVSAPQIQAYNSAAAMPEHPPELTPGYFQQHPLQQHPLQQHPLQQHPLQQHPLQQHPLQQHPLQQQPLQQQPLQQQPLQQHPLQQQPLQHQNPQPATTSAPVHIQENPASLPDLEQLLRQNIAGLIGTNKAQQLSIHEISNLVGLMSRMIGVCIPEMMRALNSRQEFKNSLRLSMTMIRAQDNNPLKFCPNLPEAIDRLLFNQGNGYLDGATAFQEAFREIAVHQLALIAALQPALRNAMELLSPQAVTEQSEKMNSRKLLATSKGRYWDTYVEIYGQLQGKSQDSLEKRFMTILSEYYEKNIDSLNP